MPMRPRAGLDRARTPTALLASRNSQQKAVSCRTRPNRAIDIEEKVQFGVRCGGFCAAPFAVDK
jgi:hypothetical protein